MKVIAEENDVKVVHFPKYFEIRWTEFVFRLINSVLQSWLALVLYMKKYQFTHKECDGYYKLLTSEENLKSMCHLADILSVFSRYQKKLQSNLTTLLDVRKYTESVKGRLQQLKETSLIGGWVSFLTDNLVTEKTGGTGEENTSTWKNYLHGIELQSPKKSRRREAHLFVTDKRKSESIINDTIETFFGYTIFHG